MVCNHYIALSYTAKGKAGIQSELPWTDRKIMGAKGEEGGKHIFGHVSM